MRWNAKLLVILACTLLVACGERTTEPVGFEWPVFIAGFVRDQDDRGIHGVEVILRRGDGTVYGRATTRVQEFDVDGRIVERGYFSFGGSIDPPPADGRQLMAGRYALTIVPPEGYVVPPGLPNPINVVLSGSGQSSSVELRITLHKN